MARVAVVFGQFDQVADPINLPHFRDRLTAAGVETILTTHEDSKGVCDFLRNYKGFCAIVGASLGAGAAALMAAYLKAQTVHFVGGFQPSDFDPVMHQVLIRSGTPPLEDIITRAVDVTSNVQNALCFRNPNLGLTGGLGHATYVPARGNVTTRIQVIEREDAHPGDFGPAQDMMFDRTISLIRAIEGARQ